MMNVTARRPLGVLTVNLVTVSHERALFNGALFAQYAHSWRTGAGRRSGGKGSG